MRRSHSFRLLCLGLVSTAAFLAGSSSAMADNVTKPFPDTTVGGDKDTVIEGDEIIYTTTMSDASGGNLTLSSVKRLVFNTANGVTFQDGVDVTGGTGLIEFDGPVTFELGGAGGTPSTNNNLNVEQLFLVGSDDAASPDAFTINNGTLTLGGSTIVNIDKNIKIAYGGTDGGLSAISDLRLGENYATRLSFGDNTVVDAASLYAGPHGTTITGSVQIGGANPSGVVAAASATSGLNLAGTITVDGNLTIDGKLTGGGSTAFEFDRAATVFLTNNAALSKLDADTQFKLSDQLLQSETSVTAFKPFDTVDGASSELLRTIREMAETLSLDQSNISELGGGEMNYDPNTGYVVIANYGGQDAMSGVPGFGVPYVQALNETHPTLAIAIKGVAKSADVSKDLSSMMGNVQNAAISAAISGNLDQVMNHLNSNLSTTMPGFAGPSGQLNGVWVTPGYTMTKITGDSKKGYSDVDVKSPNVTVGYDRWVNDRIRAGVFAAFSRPETEGDHEKIETDNLQAGIYGQAMLNYGINVNVGLGYSRQSHEATRNVHTTILDGYNQAIKASFDSSTISAAVEVSRLYPIDQNTFIRPAVGYSYVSTSMDGYTEKSNVAIKSNDLSQEVEDTDFTLHLVRLGAEGGWSDNLTTVTGRLFYVANLGDTRPKTRASMVTDSSMPFSVTGAEYDKNMFNIGLGVKYVPPQMRGMTLGLNYDALLGSNSKNHNINLMMRYEF
ncbi:hypothetical protein C4J81_01530 [Deltaproteobacteria bacterium Smac51]|nr:hypothetical protein C4J81_01530 [Deltaproteobacteria bacterium Smac51]